MIGFDFNKSFLLFLLSLFLLIEIYLCSVKYVLCPDRKSACNNGQICCARGTGYRCCPDELVCCQDGTYCCTPEFLNVKSKVASLEFFLTKDTKEDISGEEVTNIQNHSESNAQLLYEDKDEEKCVDYLRKSIIEPLKKILISNENIFNKFKNLTTILNITEMKNTINKICKEYLEDIFQSFIIDINNIFNVDIISSGESINAELTKVFKKLEDTLLKIKNNS